MSRASEGLVEDGLLTITEAQEFSRLSRSDLYIRMERGELAYCKLGRRRLIPRRALVEMASRGLIVGAPGRVQRDPLDEAGHRDGSPREEAARAR